MTGPKLSLEDVFQVAKIIFFEAGGTGGVQICDGWEEQYIRRRPLQEPDVFVDGLRVLFKICRVVELWVGFTKMLQTVVAHCKPDIRTRSR